MANIKLLFCILSTIYFSNAFDTNITPIETFTHHVVLKDNKYEVFWKLDEEDITFEVHCASKGYVGFGLSPNGGMPGSDIVIGGVKADGVTYFQDRRADSKSLPIVDVKQSYELLSASENNNGTVLKFKRKYDTCDDDDMPITNGTIRLIYAYSDSDVISYHNVNRGTKSVHLRSVEVKHPAMPSDAINWDFLLTNAEPIGTQDTTYWYQGFKVPELTQKHHVFKFDPIIQAGHEALVHHIIIYGCYHELNATELHGRGGPYMIPEWHKCTAVLFAWAIGGGSHYYPEHVGFPFGVDDQPTFFMMETHFDNPELKQGIKDSSGLRVVLSPTLRKYDAGLIEFGHGVSDAQIIPPGSPMFTEYGYCYSDCMSQGMVNQTSGIKIITGLLHAHLLGRTLKLRHFRNGVELPVVDEDLTYDFNYQESRSLPAEVTVLPGDEFSFECGYTSTSRTKITWGGLGTKQEMCLAFMIYYPKIPLTACASTPDVTDYLPIFGDEAANLNYVDIGFWRGYAFTSGKYVNNSWAQALDLLDWTPEKITEFEEIQRNSKRYAKCKYGGYDYPASTQLWGKINVTTPLAPRVKDCKEETPGKNPTQSAVTHIINMATVIIAIVSGRQLVP